MGRLGVPGVVALITDHKGIIYQGAFGVADVSTGRPLAADSLFRIASMTKAVTSAALMQLVEQGRIGLDDPAEKYLPELGGLKVLEKFDPATGDYSVRPVTKKPIVRHFLTHTSGLAYPFTSAIWRDLKPRAGETYPFGLIGWSWGTSIMATYAVENPQKVERLVLYAPQWLRTTPPPIPASGKLGAYRSVKREAARDRWLNGVPEEKKADLIPAGWFDTWGDATFASDPVGAAQTPPVLRAPNGILVDELTYYSAGKPLYDPSKIAVPTMLAVAEWDRDTPPYMAQTLFPLLTNAPAKQLVMFGEGTHTIIMEKNRMQLFNAVQNFLEEKLNGGRS